MTDSGQRDSLRSRLAVLLAILVAVLAVTFAITHITFITPASHPTVHATLPQAPASYLGVYEAGAPPGYGPVTDFARAAGKAPNLVGYYSGWAEPFDSSYAQLIRAHGVVPFVQIDPTFASVSAIADGDDDAYLRSYADSVADFGHAVVIGFGHEMNAPWYSWGYGQVPAATFVAAWRHIVTLFRSAGADNVTWLWTINADQPGTGPVADWWPGRQYVSWVGIDGYYHTAADTFSTVFRRTIQQVRAFTGRPILLSETAVAPNGNRFAKIADLFAGMRQYQTLGLAWFDITQHDGIYHQDWRIEDSRPADAAFRRGAATMALAHP